MKVIKKGKNKTPWANRKVTCQSCDAQIKLEASDTIQFIPDQRDGDYYMFKCPECGRNVTIQASLFNSSLK